MQSAWMMVERRWATMMVVLPLLRRSRASCTRRSLLLSRADVASSHSSTCMRQLFSFLLKICAEGMTGLGLRLTLILPGLVDIRDAMTRIVVVTEQRRLLAEMMSSAQNNVYRLQGL